MSNIFGYKNGENIPQTGTYRVRDTETYYYWEHQVTADLGHWRTYVDGELTTVEEEPSGYYFEGKWYGEEQN